MYPTIPLLIDPIATEPYYTMSAENVEEYRHTPVICTTSLINLSGTEPYYLMSVWHVAECRHTRVKCNTAPQSILMLQSPTTPCQFDMWDSAHTFPVQMYPNPPLINPIPTEAYYTMSVKHVEAWRHTPVTCTTSLIYPSGTEPYYLMSVWHVAECRHTKVRCNPPPAIKPSGTEHYYTRSVWHVEEFRHTQVRCTPPC